MDDDTKQLIFNICLLALISVLENNDDKEKSKLQEEKIEWSTAVIRLLIVLIISTFIITAVTWNMDRRSE